MNLAPKLAAICSHNLSVGGHEAQYLSLPLEWPFDVCESLLKTLL